MLWCILFFVGKAASIVRALHAELHLGRGARFPQRVRPAAKLRPRYNIAPTTAVDVIRLGENGQRELVPMRWGLIPGWWKKTAKEVPATFNARAESVVDKPMFRNAFKQRRCIIPASGFFEWTGAKAERQPHLFTAADGSPVLAFAGLWDRWRDPASGEDIEGKASVVS
jgi:putative SOS response-associated peptidase YedK